MSDAMAVLVRAKTAVLKGLSRHWKLGLKVLVATAIPAATIAGTAAVSWAQGCGCG
jgi:hypothetical protein